MLTSSAVTTGLSGWRKNNEIYLQSSSAPVEQVPTIWAVHPLKPHSSQLFLKKGEGVN